MLVVLDIFFHLAHISLIAFNLVGWLFAKSRRANFVCLILTGGSWFALGLRYGIGYCPLTDWHWQVKLARGEYDLPASYIEYIIDRWTPFDISAAAADTLTGAAFFAALAASLYVNFKKRR